MRRILSVGVLAAALTGTALAGDLSYYPPQQGSGFYVPFPIALQAEVGLGIAGGNTTNGIAEAALRAATPIYGVWNVELEVNDSSVFGGGNNANVAGAYIHAFHKTPQAALGGFVGICSVCAFVAGIEGNWYFGPWTLWGQAAQFYRNNNNDLAQFRGGFWYYMNDDHRVGAYVNHNTATSGNSGSATEFGIAGEKGIDNSNLSVFGRLAYVSATHSGWLALAGISWRHNSPTIRQSEQDVPFGLRYIPEIGNNNLVLSDARLKTDVVLVGSLDNGLGLYRYRYLWSDVVYVGVMAQEVEKLMPEAVVQGIDGYLRVDYGRLGTRLMTVEEWSES